jgi:hypothetical protein
LTERIFGRFVGSIVNVYGAAESGCTSAPVGDLESELRTETRIHTRVSRAITTTRRGFLEKGRQHASLHFLYIDPQKAHAIGTCTGFVRWWGSVVTALQHLYWSAGASSGLIGDNEAEGE